MNETIIKKYRTLLTLDFPNSGILEDPSIFVEAVGEKLINCGNTGNYMQLFLKVDGSLITDIRYLCSCEPVANVAVEVFCDLIKGRTLEEAATFNEETIYSVLETRDERLFLKIRGLIEMLNEGFLKYNTPSSKGPQIPSEKQNKTSWDSTLST
jgi:NifU-like protein involved in Fe-S cluster formation